MPENFSVFGATALSLHVEFERLYYVFLPVFFALALVIDWVRNPSGSPDFLSTLKRAIISTVLVAGFKEISEAIVAVTSGIADRISDLSGIDALYAMAKTKTQTYSMNATSILLGFNDLVIAIISYLSYFILYLARFVTVAVYHFMWALLTILAPLLILFGLFRGTISIPINLFRSMIEVSSYKIIWAVLSVMIQSLAFGTAYAADGDYLTVIILNFVIAIALLGTPLIVRSLVGAGLSSMSQGLGMGAVAAIASVPARAAMMVRKAGPVVRDTAGFARHHYSKMTGGNEPPITRADLNAPLSEGQTKGRRK
jgi:hypothetical protein